VAILFYETQGQDKSQQTVITHVMAQLALGVCIGVVILLSQLVGRQPPIAGLALRRLLLPMHSLALLANGP